MIDTGESYKRLERPYFYREGGKLKPYVYCSFCMSAPFKEQDVGKTVHQIVFGRQKMFACSACKLIKSLGTKKYDVEPKTMLRADAELVPPQPVLKGLLEDELLHSKPTCQEGQWFVFIMQDQTGKFITRHSKSADGTVNEINKGRHIIGLSQEALPIKLVYKRGFANEGAAASAERVVRRCSKSMKQKLVDNYVMTLQNKIGKTNEPAGPEDQVGSSDDVV